MSWQNVAAIAAILFILILAFLRAEPRRKWLIVFFLILPATVLSLRWASFRGAWDELITGCAIGLVFLGIWWLLIGRKLPPPRGSTIRVWTKDDPF
ncbi:MAG: hypothetical protein GTO14_04370 [Anaerolineales bacterium]|nr:hypothetical protein [Anaerolineales bacterium]